MKFYNLDSVTGSGNTGNLMLDVIPEGANGWLSTTKLLTDQLPKTQWSYLLGGIPPLSELKAAFDDDDDSDADADINDDDDDDFNDDEFSDDYDDEDFEDDDVDDDLEDDDLDFDDDDLELDGNDDDFIDDDFGGSSTW
jgi:hypothetical protein